MLEKIDKHGVVFAHYNDFLEANKTEIITKSVEFFFPADNPKTEIISPHNGLIEDEATLKIILFETLLFAGLNRPNIGLDKRSVFLFPVLKQFFPEATQPQLYNEIARLDTIFRHYIEPIETRNKDFNPIPSMSDKQIKYGQDPEYNRFPCWYVQGKDVAKDWDFHFDNRVKKLGENFCFGL
jgi:hypothetical protein